MSRALNDLNPKFRSIVFELLARFVEAGVPVMIIDTLRTPAEHAANLSNGTSKVKRSKHLDGLAIDVCPYLIYSANGPDKLNWDTKAPEWAILGKIGESLGLRWGGRWKDPHDPGHFEYVGKL